MRRATAIEVGQDALIWLAGEPDALGDFLAASGTLPGDLALCAAEPAFLGFLLDFILGEDQRVLAFAASAGLPPESVARARAELPGGAVPDWT